MEFLHKKSEREKSRREFGKELFSGIISYALIDSLLATQALARQVSPLLNHWSIQLHEYCQDLRKEALTITEWQDQVEALFQKIHLKELMVFIEFEDLQRRMELPEAGVRSKKVDFPRLKGLPPKTLFGKKVYGMRKKSAINPHGHSNMASAHLILNGEMHVRNYDKIVTEEDYMVIKPTLDRNMNSGDCSSISDMRDNVHWFIAKTDECFTFDVTMLNLNGRGYGIHHLDMYQLSKFPDDLLKVPIIDLAEASTKYGKVAQH